MIQKTLTSFDLKQIADSGQCFRMLPAEEANTYTVISGPHFLKGRPGRPDRDLLL